MGMPDKEVLFNKIHNGLYYHDLEYYDLVLVNTVEETKEGLSQRELSGTRESRRELVIVGYL